MSDIRYIDSLNVGAYEVESAVTILDNFENYVITATGLDATFKGNSELYFDSTNLGIGTQSPVARLEVHHSDSVDDILLIKNTTNNTGIKVDKEGIFQLLEFSTLPTAVAGGIVYSSDEFYVGMET